MCLAAPKMPAKPPPPPAPPIKMTDRIMPSAARQKSRRAAVDSTSALTIPLNKSDVGPGMPY